MKKLSTLFIAGLFAGASFAQTQRLVLVEEFTQASCGPCASQNPAFNTLLDANPTKVVAIKYQTSWPGVDPMNAQTQTWVGPRVTYYNVSGVPHGMMDGTAIVNDCNAYTGAPACLSQTDINNEYAVSAPFSLTAVHTMSSDFDSAYITITITAAQAFTSNGNLKLHLAMVEREINFSTPPGTNGEMDFSWVMRRMYPDANGTTLASSWTNAQTQTLSFNVVLPAYIYNRSQVGFVAFIQQDGNKNVCQAAYSAPVPVTNDAGVTTLTGLPIQQCSGTFTPTVTIINSGAVNLTSCTINMQIDANTPTTLPWTGNLAPSATTNVVLPSQSAGDGSHTFTVWTTIPNGVQDYNPSNDQQLSSFVINTVPDVTPLVEGYQNTTFAPNGWAISNPDNGPTWTRRTGAGGFGNSTACAKMDFFNSTSGNVDEFYMPLADLSGSSTSASLSFNVAYAQYSSENDRLEVKVSTDCGSSWTTVFSKSGATLKTANPTTSAFTPNATQWRNEIVNLNTYAGNNSVLIKFTATSAYGNNLYIDDINLANTTSVEEHESLSGMVVFPNPFAANATISLFLNQSEEVSVRMYNVMGEMVKEIPAGSMNAGENTLSVDGSDLSSGVYYITVTAGGQTITQKVTISH
ncbi:MAG: T9SS type A sorting domain-containing protein [Bacteroidia bacterium]|nr:T9SS type A sorting domain-containing protein [Bacteroidia bacterium]